MHTNVKRISTTFSKDLSKETISGLEKELLERRAIDLNKLTPEEKCKMLKSRCINMFPEEKILTKFKLSAESGRPLVVKFGIDPTSAELHLGHAVPMIILNRLQRMGNKIIFVIGDFTAKIGDPSGRITARPALSDEQIRFNFSTYKEQVSPFFDFSKAEIVFNSQWLTNIKLSEFFSILQKLNVSEVLQREDFRKRLELGYGLKLSEFLYAVVMAIDSVHLKSDIEVGGVDQLLNLHMCRKLMELHEVEPECILTTELLIGISGESKKMSKSYGNYIALRHEPEEIFGRIMSIPDSLLETYFKALTEIYDEEWKNLDTCMQNGKINPMEVKKLLGRILVSILYDSKAAHNACKDFELKFSQKSYEKLKDVNVFNVNSKTSIMEFLISNNLSNSKSEVRRLCKGGGLQIISYTHEQAEKIDNPYIVLQDLHTEGFFLKIGKRKVIKVILKSD